MPNDNIATAALSTIPFIGNIAGSAINNYYNNRATTQSLIANADMYNRQRADSISDWKMQNEYNSPLAQMQRYKDAGLNPNLIYGQSNVAQPVRSTDFKKPDIIPNQVNPDLLGNSMMVALNLINKSLDNTNKAMEAQFLTSKKNFTDWQLNRSQQLFPADKDFLESKIYKNQTGADVDIMRSRTLRGDTDPVRRKMELELQQQTHLKQTDAQIVQNMSYQKREYVLHQIQTSTNVQNAVTNKLRQQADAENNDVKRSQILNSIQSIKDGIRIRDNQQMTNVIGTAVKLLPYLLW